MDKQKINTTAAPIPAGPYSQGIQVGQMIYTAGQVALDPATGKLVGDTIAEQTARVLDNVAAVLEAAGSSLAHVVKTTVFLSDLAHFGGMNEVYSRYFPGDKPARSTVGVALPPGILVEIEAVAVIP